MTASSGVAPARFVVPASWRRSIHPRRGGVQVAHVPAPGVIPGWPGVRAVLEDAGTAPEAAAAGLAMLDGAVTPFGAAVVSAVLFSTPDVPDLTMRGIVDDWIVRFGLPFAAVAAMEYIGLRAVSRQCSMNFVEVPVEVRECGDRPCDGHLTIVRRGRPDRGFTAPTQAVLGPVRAAVAAAPDHVHAEVVEALTPYRGQSLRRRMATSFIDPTRAAWVEADSLELAGLGHFDEDAPLLLAAVHTVAQAIRVQRALHADAYWSLREPIMMHTVAEGIGDGIIDVYFDWWYRSEVTVADRQALLTTLAVIPSDRTFLEMLDHLSVRGAQAAVEAAAERFPARAMRLLSAAADRPRVAELLRRHVARHPALAPAAPAGAGWPTAGATVPATAPAADPGAAPAVAPAIAGAGSASALGAGGTSGSGAGAASGPGGGAAAGPGAGAASGLGGGAASRPGEGAAVRSGGGADIALAAGVAGMSGDGRTGAPGDGGNDSGAPGIGAAGVGAAGVGAAGVVGGSGASGVGDAGGARGAGVAGSGIGAAGASGPGASGPGAGAAGAGAADASAADASAAGAGGSGGLGDGGGSGAWPAGAAGAAVIPVSGPVIAAAGAVPAVLASPPWTVRRKVVKPVVLADLRCADEPAAVWPPGERERLVARLSTLSSRHDPRERVEQFRAGTLNDWFVSDLLQGGPEEIVAPLLSLWSPQRLRGVHYWLPRIAARFGVAALPLVLRIARRSPGDGGPALMPFTAPEVALLAADWHGRLKAARAIALTWLRRHPVEAARALVPAALGKPGLVRRHAGQALLALASSGHRDTVLAAAEGYGAAAGAAIRALLDTDPLDLLPSRIPAPPAWADPATLPPVRLRGGEAALPADAAGHLITMLMLSKLGDPYAGIALVRDACDPADLARFAWVLLERWEAADAPPADGWALEAQAVLGDDETAVRLAAAVRAWPYQGAHKRAASGLDTLAQLGTDAALTQLQDIAAKMKAKAVKARAELKLREVAETLELTSDQLADRLVPHLDLAPDATLTLDYGRRRFTGGFDDQLKPYVIDASGARRKDLPDPAASDDQHLAPAAQRRFTDAKKTVRKVAAEQTRRLERAMIMRRRWTGAEFERTFLRHPLLWPIARRLVWLVSPAPTTEPVASTEPTTEQATPTGPAEHTTATGSTEHTTGTGPTEHTTGTGPTERTTPTGPAEHTTAAGSTGGGVAFRLAEDRTAAGVDDAPVVLDGDAVVSVAHPVDVDVRAWTELFADYEILQPFRQLSRPVHALAPEELGATRLARFDGRKALTVKLVALERRGWRRADQDGGHQGRIECDLAPGPALPGGATLVVDLDPGIAMGAPARYPEQSLRDVWICPSGEDQWSRDHRVPFSALDPASASELLGDLGSCF